MNNREDLQRQAYIIFFTKKILVCMVFMLGLPLLANYTAANDPILPELHSAFLTFTNLIVAIAMGISASRAKQEISWYVTAIPFAVFMLTTLLVYDIRNVVYFRFGVFYWVIAIVAKFAFDFLQTRQMVKKAEARTAKMKEKMETARKRREEKAAEKMNDSADKQ